MHEPHQRTAEQKPKCGQNHSNTHSGYKGCTDTAFHLPVFPGSKIQGNNYRAPNVQPRGNCHEDHGNRVRCPHCCQCIHSHKFSCYNTVHNIIKLLEHDTDQHGNGKTPQYMEWLSLCHICNHSYLILSFLSLNMSLTILSPESNTCITKYDIFSSTTVQLLYNPNEEYA